MRTAYNAMARSSEKLITGVACYNEALKLEEEVFDILSKEGSESIKKPNSVNLQSPFIETVEINSVERDSVDQE